MSGWSRNVAVATVLKEEEVYNKDTPSSLFYKGCRLLVHIDNYRLSESYRFFA